MAYRRYSRVPRMLVVIFIVIGLAPTITFASVSEDDLKLVLLYKITRFVDWPDSHAGKDHDFRLCLSAAGTHATAKERLGNRRIQDREIQLILIEKDTDNLSCDAVYITESDRERAADLLGRFADRPVLTVSDAPEFAQLGGIVGLSMSDNRVRISINITAYKRAGLALSSQLLELATVVESDGGVKP